MDENKILASTHYQSLGCVGKAEFDKDYRLPRVIAIGLKRWIRGQNINLRVIMNNVIIFFNVFEHDFAVKQIFKVNEAELYPELKAILLVLNKTKITDQPNIQPNQDLLNALEKELEC